jgi:hypothetical protein
MTRTTVQQTLQIARPTVEVRRRDTVQLEKRTNSISKTRASLCQQGKLTHRRTIAPDYRRANYRHGRSASSQATYAKALSPAGTPEHGSSEKSNHNIYDEEFVGAVIPKRSANSCKKIWESLIQWGDFLANENRIDRDPGTLHL